MSKYTVNESGQIERDGVAMLATTRAVYGDGAPTWAEVEEARQHVAVAVNSFDGVRAALQEIAGPESSSARHTILMDGKGSHAADCKPCLARAALKLMGAA